MNGEEKFNSCTHKPNEQIEVFDGCPCQKRKKLVHQCTKRSIIDIKAEICETCDLFENKNP
jgi:hypothetical protein